MSSLVWYPSSCCHKVKAPSVHCKVGLKLGCTCNIAKKVCYGLLNFCRIVKTPSGSQELGKRNNHFSGNGKLHDFSVHPFSWNTFPTWYWSQHTYVIPDFSGSCIFIPLTYSVLQNSYLKSKTVIWRYTNIIFQYCYLRVSIREHSGKRYLDWYIKW